MQRFGVRVSIAVYFGLAVANSVFTGGAVELGGSALERRPGGCTHMSRGIARPAGVVALAQQPVRSAAHTTCDSYAHTN